MNGHRLSRAAAAAGLCIAGLLGGCAGSGDSKAASPAALVETSAPNPGAFEPLDLNAPSATRSASGAPGPGYWQQQVDFSIDATLHAQKRELTASGTVTYHNNSPDRLEVLFLGLEQNLFRLNSAGAALNRRGGRFGNRDGFDGGFTIAHVTTLDGRQIPLQVTDTIGRLELPEPINPGAVFAFRIAWSFEIPPYGSDRMGVKEDSDGAIFEMAQWFPNVCVYDDVHGWNTLPYLGAGEFYTNYGDYDVRLTVPADHIVAATGVLQNGSDVLTLEQQERLAQARGASEPVLIRAMNEVGKPSSRPTASGGEIMWHFKAEGVRTFAFASSASFIWDALGYRTPDGRDVLLQSVYPPSVNPNWRNSTGMLKRAIDHYSRMWAPYPYPSATNVHGICGGMEYPMIVFCSAAENEDWLWGVTNHEIGHTWFPMLINTDERRHAWMDEGFNTFINYYANLERTPDNLPARGNPRATADWMARIPIPIETPADDIPSGLLGALEYGKTAAGLVLLRETILGPDRFDPAFRAYVKAWSFKSPRPGDFYRMMENQSGEELDWFFRGWFRTPDSLDQAIQDVTIETTPDGGTASVTFANMRGLVMPLDYEVRFGDGVTERRRIPVRVWAAGATFTDEIPLAGRTLEAIVIDPDEGMPDINPENNTWNAK